MNYLPSTIINFHAIYNEQWIDKVLLLLKKCYRMVSLDEIESYYYEGQKLKNACHITFDDGDKSFYNIVFPLLKKYNIPASIYVSPTATIEHKNFWFQEIRGYDSDILFKILSECYENNGDIQAKPINAIFKSMTIDKIWEVIYQYQNITKTPKKPFINLNVNQLTEIFESGLVSIGAHTINHPILKNESAIKTEEEIKSSIVLLGDLLNYKVKYFAYPNGFPGLDFGEREKEILRKLQIKLSFSTENKNFNIKDDKMSIPRKGISKGSSSLILVKLLMGKSWDIAKKFIKYKQENNFRS